MNERIKAARKALGLTMEQFGKRVGLSKSAISLIESGKNGTTEQTVASICREFGVNELWLRTGEGEMFAAPTAASDKIMDFAAEIARNDDKEFRKRLVVMLADLEPKDWELLERIAEKLTK